MAALGLLVGPRPAAAQVLSACSMLTSSAPTIYVAGPSPVEGSAIEALVQAVTSAAQAVTRIVYLPTPPCSAIAAVSMAMPAGITGFFMDPAVGPTACIPPSAPPDLGLSDASPSGCSAALGFAPLSALGELDTLGPIEPAAIVVAAGSPWRSISADAAYVVFGFRAAAPYVVEGWGDPASIFVPAPSSGILSVVGQTIGLAPAHWAGAKNSTLTSTTAMIGALNRASQAATTIGLLPGPIAERQPSVRILAYQHSGERCGYLPDSDAVHFDKINLRQGRYALWAPIHMITRRDIAGRVVDATGQPNPMLASVVDALSAGDSTTNQGAIAGSRLDGGASGGPGDARSESSSPGAPADTADGGHPPGIDPIQLIEAVAHAGFVPWCAMQVRRDTAADAEASFEPELPCGCAFESSVGATTSYCAPCQSDADCSGRVARCRFGYCEAR